MINDPAGQQICAHISSDNETPEETTHFDLFGAVSPVPVRLFLLVSVSKPSFLDQTFSGPTHELRRPSRAATFTPPLSS